MILHILGILIAVVVLAFWGTILLGAVELLLPKWDCSQRGHIGAYYGCTVCRAPYGQQRRDKYHRPCCILPDYDWQCGVCHMRVPKPKGAKII